MATKAEAARLNGQKGGRPKKQHTVLGTPTPIEATAQAVQAAVPVVDTPPLDNPFDLTPKELLFVEAYCGVANFNASDAYRIAGFEGKPASVTANAARLIAKDRVSAAISDRLSARVQQLRVMDGDEALGRLTMYARSDIGKVLGPDDPIANLPDDVRATVKTVREGKYGRTIELYDAMRATELLAKASGKLREIVQVESLEQLIAKSMQPAQPAGATA